MKRITTGVIAAVSVAAVSIAVASPAVAAATPTPPPSGAKLAKIQQRGETDITNRLASLQKATTRVQNAKDVSAADRTQLLALFASDSSALTALNAKIAADTDVATARADVATISSTYRIFGVVLPQTSIALGADRLSTTSIPKVQAAHDKLAAKGADATQLTAMQSDITAAANDVSGLSASALAVTPTQYDANHAVMTPLRQRLAQAIVSLRQAVVIGRTLLGTHPGAGTHSGAGTSTPTPTPTPSAPSTPGTNS